jgi:hypothetical protein
MPRGAGIPADITANLQVVNGTVLVPDPFFEPFRTDIEGKLSGVKWVDTKVFWLKAGGIHCGSNCIRTK